MTTYYIADSRTGEIINDTAGTYELAERVRRAMHRPHRLRLVPVAAADPEKVAEYRAAISALVAEEVDVREVWEAWQDNTAAGATDLDAKYRGLFGDLARLVCGQALKEDRCGDLLACLLEGGTAARDPDRGLVLSPKGGG